VLLSFLQWLSENPNYHLRTTILKHMPGVSLPVLPHLRAAALFVSFGSLITLMFGRALAWAKAVWEH
jgi:hypothetical protein